MSENEMMPGLPDEYRGYAGRMARFWTFIADKLDAGIEAWLLYVLESNGSSPGRQGFAMAVSADQNFVGSIGGGIMEHKLVETVLSANPQEQKGLVFKQIHNRDASRYRSGMICSGEQTVLLYPVHEQDRQAIQSLILSWQNLSGGGLIIRPTGLDFTADTPTEKFKIQWNGDDDFYMLARSGFSHKLHIVGGGHCSLALSKLMSDMDFHIHVYETRKGLNTFDNNLFAHKRILLDGYDQLKNVSYIGEDDFVLVMSFGYRTDDEAMRALMHRRYRFLGLLGSKRKVSEMLDTYKKEGFQEEYLSGIFAPVGVFIKSETPEEIAVSIAAQLISVKNKAL